MHVVLFEFVPHYGGAARSEIAFAQRLKQHASVSIVDAYGACEPFARAVRESGVDYYGLYPGAKSMIVGGHGRPLYRLWRVLASMPRLLKVRARAKALLGDLKPSVVCTNNFKGGLVLAAASRRADLPVILHLRGWYTPNMVPWYAKWVCNKRCAAVIAVSYATRAALYCSGVDMRKTFVLHNPIDVDEMLALADRPLAAALPQAGRAVRILLPAGIMRAKGQHTAVQAMRRILDAGHDAVLWIAGDHQPVGANKYYLDDTKALAEELGVADRVEWIGLRSDVPQAMKAATIVILPSHAEGHPRVILEAMALAKPVAATPAGGIMDMILPGLTGLYFDVDDAAGLATCVNRLAVDPVAALRMGRTAQEYVRTSFRAEDQVSRALEIFRQVAGWGPPGVRTCGVCGDVGNAP